MSYIICNNCNILMDVSHQVCILCKKDLANKALSTPYEYTQLPNKFTISHIRYYTIIYKALLSICLAFTIINLSILLYRSNLNLIVLLSCLAMISILYLSLYRFILAVLYNTNLGYKNLVLLMCTVVSLCVFLDLYDYVIDWSWYIVLPTVVLLGNVLCMFIVIFSKSVSTNAVFWTLLMSVIGVVVGLIIIPSLIDNIGILLVNYIYVLVEISFAVYMVLFRYIEFMTTAHAKLHF